MLLLLVFVVTSATAETVYKTVDEHGNVIFTDKQEEGAEEIHVEEAQTISNPHAGDYRHRPYQKKRKPAVRYSAITISAPANDSVVQGNEGNVSISVATTPNLRSGDQIEISMDGGKVASGSASSYTVSNVARGTHTLIAKIVGRDGKTLTASSPITFHLQRQVIKKQKR